MLHKIESDKKKALFAQKQKLLQDIKYYESRIDEVRQNVNKSSLLDDNSSDSDSDFMPQIDSGPSIAQLKHDQSMLKTCLQATQELTSLEVLQSEVQFMVEEPDLTGEPGVTEPGQWLEVTAECCIDLVPFTITFYAHKPERQFGPMSYRGVRLAAVKAAHELELARSVLPGVARPSDAVEVVRSYAAAQRSRRGSLARLADRFASALHMEPHPEGGYLLKCANLLEVTWTLQNKWSPVARFHHRMKFDLEYMDEEYIKTITQTHRQLSDPNVDTDERTLLLARIISTCLQAQGPTQELHESLSSDPESGRWLENSRTTLDREPDVPERYKEETEIMAPPKSLPKKANPKSKENKAENRKAVKRSIADNGGPAKKLKTTDSSSRKEEVGDGNTGSTSVASAKNKSTNSKTSNGGRAENEVGNNEGVTEKNEKSVERKVPSAKKNSSKVTGNQESAATVEKTIKKKVVDPKEGTNTAGTKKEKNSVAATEKNKLKAAKIGGTIKENTKVVNTGEQNEKNKVSLPKTAHKQDNITDTANKVKGTIADKDSKKKAIEKKVANVVSNKNIGNTVESVTSVENNQEKKNMATKKVDTAKTVKPIAKNVNSAAKNSAGRIGDAENNNINTKNSETKDNNEKKGVKTKKTTDLANNPAKKLNTDTKTHENTSASNAVAKPTIDKDNKNTKTTENANPTKEPTKQNSNKLHPPKKLASINKINKEGLIHRFKNNSETNITKKKLPLKNSNKPTGGNTPKGKMFHAGNTEKENSGEKTSRIPQKLSSITESAVKKNPLRISPRKLVSKAKMSPKFGGIANKKTIQKPITKLPRLMTKPKPKLA